MQTQLISSTSFYFTCNDSEICLDLDAISHISKYGNEVVIYTSATSFRTKHKIKDLQVQLPENLFFRIHRSHIISLKYLDGYKRRRVRINGDYLPVSINSKLRLITELKKRVDQSFRFYDSTNQNNCYETPMGTFLFAHAD
ncbi:MAG TPA: LytTR family DNA-binding domain-containing protein [Chitinophagaceae bacterium]